MLKRAGGEARTPPSKKKKKKKGGLPFLFYKKVWESLIYYIDICNRLWGRCEVGAPHPASITYVYVVDEGLTKLGPPTPHQLHMSM